MNSFNERVKVLVELLDEGHITNDEFASLVDSLRGGAVNEAYDVEYEKKDGINIAGHALSYEEEYQREIDNPNKLEDYDNFLNGEGAFTDTLSKELDHLVPSDSFMGFYREDVNSGNILRGCNIVTLHDGKLKCIEPFHSYEDNTTSITQDEIEHIRRLLKEGKIVVS